MSVTLNPYLNFRGKAREALEFYQAAFGGSLTIGTFAEMGMEVAPEESDHVMHGHLQGDNGLVLMAADIPSNWPAPDPVGVSISLSGVDEAALRGYWDALADGGEIQQPLVPAPWGDTFGMLQDKFGVGWLVNIVVPRG